MVSKGEEENMASTPFKFQLKGTINGKSFTVEGEGEGDPHEGSHKGKYVCTSGKLPMSWAALGTTFGYGMKYYTKYPSGLKNWFREVMPGGFTYDRHIQYTGDGSIHAKHQHFMKNGTYHNIVEFTGQDFKENSPVLTGDMNVNVCPVEELAIYFRIFDRNADGFLDAEELAELLRATGVQVAEEDMGDMMKDSDKNNDGRIDFDEFLKMMEGVQQHTSLPTEVPQIPRNDGIECPVTLLYPLLSDKSKYVEAHQYTICKPLHNQPAPDVPYHWIRKQYAQSKDDAEERDHICQSETLVAHLKGMDELYK
uniref:icBTnC2 - the genetically-encoded green calcium sensor based on the fluorescent protein mBaoJin and calcium binding domain of C-terminal minimal domain of troponin C from Calypte Anna n=1 Tax=synthetic construct TaxID=32630 RepID=UPI004040CB48